MSELKSTSGEGSPLDAIRQGRETAHYVYRIYGNTGQLLYVGCTRRLVQRLKQHWTGAWWGDQARRATARVYRTKAEALAAERHAIRTEWPRWNLVGSFQHRNAWGRQNFIDYAINALSQPVITPYTLAHLRNVARLYEARFSEIFPVELQEAS